MWETTPSLINSIAARMYCDGARMVTDDEIDRTLAPCVAGPSLIKIAADNKPLIGLDLDKFIKDGIDSEISDLRRSIQLLQPDRVG